MLKLGTKRRKTKHQLIAEREEAEWKAEAEANSQSRIQELEQQLKTALNEEGSNAAAAEILSGYISKGKMRMENDGTVSLVESPARSNYMELEKDEMN